MSKLGRAALRAARELGFVVKKLFVLTLVTGLLPALWSFEAEASARCCGVSGNPLAWRHGVGVAARPPYTSRYYTGDVPGTGARGYARRASSDPMVWSDAQWRSTLFGGYARTNNSNYDRRFRRGEASALPVVRIEKILIAGPTHMVVTEPAMRRGPRIGYLHRNSETERLELGSDYAGHQCRGILVLTWKAGVARSQCVASNTRIRKAPE